MGMGHKETDMVDHQVTGMDRQGMDMQVIDTAGRDRRADIEADRARETDRGCSTLLGD